MSPRDAQKATVVDDAARQGLAKITELILPGTSSLPSGVSVGAHLDLLDRALTADPRLAPAVVSFGRRAEVAPELTLGDLQEWSECDAETVVFAITAAYYMSPAVKAALGYPGPARRPISEATAEEKQTDELLAPVIARGSIYVPTPDERP